MIVDGNINENEELRTLLSANIRQVSSLLYTFIIEILEGIGDEKRLDIRKYYGVKNVNAKSFSETTIEIKEKFKGLYVPSITIEHTAATSILYAYYPPRQKYIAENIATVFDRYKEDFPKEMDLDEFFAQCRMRAEQITLVRSDRNNFTGHNTGAASMKDIISWINDISRFLSSFTSYEMEKIPELKNSTVKKKLIEYQRKINEYFSQCTGVDKNKAFKFRKEYYLMSEQEEGLLELQKLTRDFAEDDMEDVIEHLSVSSFWDGENGLRSKLWAIAQDTKDITELSAVVEKLKTSKAEQRCLPFCEFVSRLVYISRIKRKVNIDDEGIDGKGYQISFDGFAWRGEIVSLNMFASKLLYMLIRSSKRSDIEAKVNGLSYRILMSGTWDSNNKDENKDGLGIDIISFCKSRIISRYFEAKGDNDGLQKAALFESVIEKYGRLSKKNVQTTRINGGSTWNGEILIDDINSLIKSYKKDIECILELAFYIKGSVSYYMEIGKGEEREQLYFNTIDKYKDYIKSLILKDDCEIEKVLNIIKSAENDESFRFFIDNAKQCDQRNTYSK